MNLHLNCFLVLTLLALPGSGLAQARRSAPVGDETLPAIDFRERATPYAGPGREVATDPEVNEILIGYFGPDDPNHLVWGDAWLAATLAIDEANLEGGYQGKPFRLVPAWSENPWGTGISRLAQLAYKERVWAILGGLDGNSAHLAEQVAAKARLPLLCTTSTDRTANAANVPWIFSMMPGDHLQAPLLASELSSRVGSGRFTLLSASDHDSRAFTLEIGRSFNDTSLHPARTFVLSSSVPPGSDLVQQVLRDCPEAIVIAADARMSGQLVRLLRDSGYEGLLLGRSCASEHGFLAMAGPAAAGFLYPDVLIEGLPCTFLDAFQARAGHPPDVSAAYTYDGAKLLVAAIRRAGLSRARIGDALRDVTPWPGVTGTFSWDSLGSSNRTPRLGVISPTARKIDAETPGNSTVPAPEPGLSTISTIP